MKLCYRGVEYDRTSIVNNLNGQQQAAIDRSLSQAQTVQMKFLGQFFDQKVFNLATTRKNISFMGRKSDRPIVNPSEVKAIA